MCFGSAYSKLQIFNTLEGLIMVGGKRNTREQRKLVRDPHQTNDGDVI